MVVIPIVTATATEVEAGDKEKWAKAHFFIPCKLISKLYNPRKQTIK